MNRIITFAALAALMAGCSDAPVAPRLSLHATGPSFDVGDPPPPPVSGSGSGTFSASSGEFAVILQNCSVGPITTQYHFDYTTDNATDPGMNQVAHIKFDEDLSHQITIHQELHGPVEVDANGTIVGPSFSFNITSSQGGFLTPPPGGAFAVSVTGNLKTPDGPPCKASGQFSGTLAPSD